MSAHQDKSEVATGSTNENRPRPYLNPDGTLVIPMLAEAKYHWWKPGGQTVQKTLEELGAAGGQDGR